MLARGRVSLPVMGATWAQNGAGLATFADQLPAILDRMVGRAARKPRVVCSDRGPGM